MNVIDISKIDTGCVKQGCEFAFKVTGTHVCIRNPPTPVPIPQQNMAGEMQITINPVFAPCPTDTICGEYKKKEPTS